MAGNIIALGFFDGVHRGHAEILRQTADIGHATGARPVALTFDVHPRALVRGAAPRLITSDGERRRLLLAFGMDDVISLPFDREMADMPPLDFAGMLIKEHGAVATVCGADFRFGRRAAGTPALLREAGLSVTVCPPVLDGEGRVISSTTVRAFAEVGDMMTVCRHLGRPFALEGVVENGHKNGRALGYPTVNIPAVPGLLLPLRGVYVTRVTIDGAVYDAVTNIGRRPTFGGGRDTIESHIIDYSGDAYGMTCRVELIRFIRPEQAFSSPAGLAARIGQDIEEARRVIAALR